MTTNASGQPESKENIKKKQKELFNVLFANNSEEESIKFTATDIGLDKTISDALDGTQLKKNVLVLKKNQETAIVVSEKVSEDTGIYADLSEFDDTIKFDIGTGKDVQVFKSEDSSISEAQASNTVSVVSTDNGNKYTINGVIAPTLTLVKGNTYRFNQGDISNNNHPFRFHTSETHEQDVYTDGVSNYYGTAGTSGAYIEITVATNAPSRLYYQCENHDGMGGIFQIVDTSASDKWTVSYDGTDYTREAGSRVHLDDVTIYIGSVYIDGNTSGIPSSGVMDLTNYRIIYDPSDNILLTKRASNSKIMLHRHSAIEKIWTDNVSSNSFLAYSSQLGLDKTVGKPLKSIVKVHKAKNGEGADNTVVSDLTSPSEITKHQGSYAAIRDLNDYIIFKSPNDNNFRVQVTEVNPTKGYMIRDTANQNNLSENTFRDGQWTTYDGVNKLYILEEFILVELMMVLVMRTHLYSL